MINNDLYFDIKHTCDTKQVKLIAVSKTKPIEAISILYNLGQRDFAENKVQDLVEKKAVLFPDIKWHFIGNLQENKVNKIVGNCFLIHSVDSMKLANKINLRAEKLGINQSILLQLNVDNDPNKQGFSSEQLLSSFLELNSYKNISILGLMTIGEHTEDSDKIYHTFTNLKKNLVDLNEKFNVHLTELSMGMSSDYLLAIKAGSTMIRIGSSLFGKRS